MDAQDDSTLDWLVCPLSMLDATNAAKKGFVGTLKTTFSHRVEVMGAKKVDGDGMCEKYGWNE